MECGACKLPGENSPRSRGPTGYVLGGALYIIACVTLRWVLLPPWNYPASILSGRETKSLLVAYSLVRLCRERLISSQSRNARFHRGLQG